MYRNNGSAKIKIILVAIILIILVLLILAFVTNKSEVTISEQYSTDYEYFAMYSLDGKVGVIDKNGETVVEPIYTKIYIPNQSKDVFLCFDDEKNVIINKKQSNLFTNFEEVSVIEISDITGEVEQNVLSYKENNLYGLVDLEGNKLTDAIYENVESLKNKPGNILVKKDGLYGVLNYNGDEIIEVKYNSIKSDEYSSEKDGYNKAGYIISEKTSTGIIYGYVDYTGNMLIEPKYESISRMEDEDIYLVVMENGKKGVLKEKKQIIKNQYQSINYYNVSEIFIVNKNGKYGFINANGKQIIKTDYTSYSIAGNYIFVKKDDNSYLFDIHGNSVNNNNYKSIIETGNPSYFIAQSEDGYYSIISKDDIIEDNYKNISYAFDNFFIFTNDNGKSGLLNIYSGEEIAPEYDYILVIDNANALQAIKGDTVDIYSSDIIKMVSIENGVVENIGTDYFVIHSDSEMVYFNSVGEIVSNTEVYSDLSIYASEKNGKWGYTDKDGNVKVNYDYDLVTEVNEYGFAGIYLDGKWGVINEEGKVIVEPSYEMETYYFPQFIGKYLLQELEIYTVTEVE